MAVKTTVNGREQVFEEPVSGAELLAQLNLNPSTVVVELNGGIIKREEFLERRIEDGDVLELVTIVGGG